MKCGNKPKYRIEIMTMGIVLLCTKCLAKKDIQDLVAKEMIKPERVEGLEGKCEGVIYSRLAKEGVPQGEEVE